MPTGCYPRVVNQRPAYGKPLSRREAEALRTLAEGLTLDECAERMGICRKVVERHRLWAYLKLGARNGPHAVALAIRAGVL